MRRGIWKDRPALWRWGIVLLCIAGFGLLIIISSRYYTLRAIGITCGSVVIGALFLILSRGKNKRVITTDKIGIWANRPADWKFGIIILAATLMFVILYLFNGGSVEVVVLLAMLAGAGIFLMVSSTRENPQKFSKKTYWNSHPLSWHQGIMLIILQVFRIIFAVLLGSAEELIPYSLSGFILLYGYGVFGVCLIIYESNKAKLSGREYTIPKQGHLTDEAGDEH